MALVRHAAWTFDEAVAEERFARLKEALPWVVSTNHKQKGQHNEVGRDHWTRSAQTIERVWAVEGSNGIGNSIAQRLVKAGEVVFDVPAKLATRVRVYSTGHGTKIDDADAVAIARAAIHSRHLRQVQSDGASVAIRLLSDRRQELVAARTQAVTRLHRLLRELISGGAKQQLSAEEASCLLNDLDDDDPATLTRIEIARDHITDIERLDLKLDEYSLRLIEQVKTSQTTLTRLFGIGPLNAALILGDVGDVSRFPSRNHFASYTGTAPISVSSGDHNRHRLSRSGNRRLNRVTHIAAITQIRFDTPGRSYYRRKLAEGKRGAELLRLRSVRRCHIVTSWSCLGHRADRPLKWWMSVLRRSASRPRLSCARYGPKCYAGTVFGYKTACVDIEHRSVARSTAGWSCGRIAG